MTENSAAISTMSSPIDFRNLYSQAVITMCWIITRHKTAETPDEETFRQLVFASVELIPKFITLQTVMSNPTRDMEQREKFSGFRIFFIRLIVSASQGMDLYEESLKNGFITMFWDEGKKVHMRPHGAAGFRLLSYPRYPQTAYLADSPIIPKCWNHAQVNHFMPLDPLIELRQFVSHENVADWIGERLGWRLEDNIEFLGCICLIAPNPHYCRSCCSLRTDSTGEGFDVVEFRVDRVPSNARPPLTVIFAERYNGNELGNIQHRRLDAERLDFSLRGRVNETGYAVVDQSGTIWDMQNFSPFIRSISLEMGIVDKELVFTCKDGEEQRITKFGEVRDMVIEAPDDTTQSIALSQKIVSIRKGNRRTNDQFIYYRKSGEAERKIRDLINSARKSVLIVDPYYSPKTATLFLTATRSSEVKTTILCTEGGLRNREDGTNPAKELLAIVQKADKDIQGPTDVKVCPHDKLHDRFIVIDDNEAWLLGSSLNTLGDSLSAIVRIDNPQLTLIPTVDDIIHDKETCELDNWIATHKEARPSVTPTPCCS